MGQSRTPLAKRDRLYVKRKTDENEVIKLAKLAAIDELQTVTLPIKTVD